MESFILSLNAVAPIFLLMVLGYVIKKASLMDKKKFDALNKVVFRIFLPVLLFYNIYSTSIERLFNPRLVVFCLIGIFAVFALASALVPLIIPDDRRRGVIIQGIFRSNYAVLGVPLLSYIFGKSDAELASVMVAVVVSAFNVLAVVALQRYCSRKADFKNVLLGVLKNPLIIGCITGLVFLLLKIRLPSAIESAVSSYAMVQQMEGDETLAGHLVVFSSLLCLPTLFVWIYLLNLLALI